MNALLICSGGLDSVTLAYRLAAEQSLGALLTFDYGQRHPQAALDAYTLCAAGYNAQSLLPSGSRT